MTVDLIKIYDDTFREKELEQIIQTLVEGDSACLIGVGTVGKTHLLQYLTQREDVQKRLLSRVSGNFVPDDFLWVHLDPNALLEEPDLRVPALALPQSWRGYELLLRRMIDTLRQHPRLGKKWSDRALELHDRLFSDDLRAPLRALLWVEALLDDLAESTFGDGRIVIVIDEMQRFLGELPDSFFLSLRALRDRHRYRLVFLTAQRQELREIVAAERRETLEPFLEIFRRDVYLSRARTRHDFDALLHVLTVRMNADDQIAVAFTDDLYNLTGGHAGLVRTCFRQRQFLQRIIHKTSFPSETIIYRLIPGIHRECETIWQSLNNDEQALLKSLPQSVDTSQRMDDPSIADLISKLRQLENKGVVVREGQKYSVYPPLLAQYIENHF